MAWINPFYNPGNSVAGGGNVRFDHTQPGSGIPGARTFADGARLLDAYAKSGGNTVYSDAVKWMREKGFDPATASDQVKFTALDWVFRDRQRGNKKTNSFGDSVLGKALGIAAPVAGSFFGPAGAALGGAIGGGATGGLKGAALGAGIGYAGAKYVAPFVKSKFGGAFGTSGVVAPPTGSVAGRALNAALPGTFGAGTPLTSAGTGALGLGSGLGAGALLSGAASGAGGNGVGFFDSFGSGLGSVFGNVAGSVVGGLIGGAGDRKAAEQFEDAARDAQLIVQPSPFQASGLFTQAGPGGQAGLTSYGNRQFDMLDQLQRGAFDRATDFDPNAFRDRLMQAADRVTERREGQLFNSLESRLFNQQGASTGTARQIADFRRDIENAREDRRFKRAIEADLLSEQVQRGRLGDFAGTYNLLGNLDDRFRSTQQQSLFGAQALSPFGINNPAIAQAGAFRAQNTQDFFRGLGGLGGGLVDTGISLLGNPFASSGPAATTSGNPFQGVGPLTSFGGSSGVGSVAGRALNSALPGVYDYGYSSLGI